MYTKFQVFTPTSYSAYIDMQSSEKNIFENANLFSPILNFQKSLNEMFPSFPAYM